MSDEVPVEVQNTFPDNSGDSNQRQAQLSGNVQAQYFQQAGQSENNEKNYNFQGFNSHQQPQTLQDTPSQQVFQSQSESGDQNQNHYHSKSYSPPDDAQVNDKLFQMEHEAAQLRALDAQLDSIAGPSSSGENAAARSESDARSIYIGNVDYGATPLELQQHFSESGVVERVTIMTNKLTGQPKGFAYLEFALAEGANKAAATQNGSLLRDRELKVSLKRTNVPGLSTTNRDGPRGRGRGRGIFRGRGRAGFRGRGAFRGSGRFQPY